MQTPRGSQATVTAAWLAQHASDPGIRIIEVDVSGKDYSSGHIPNAILWNAYTDLRNAAYTPASPEKLQQLLSRSDITTKDTIVFYGYAAALGFWLMKAHGQHNVRMLNGSRDQWPASGQHWSSVALKPTKSAYPPLSPDTSLLASRRDVAAAIGKPGHVILDVRTEPEYKGAQFWPSGTPEAKGRSGHIPTAVNVPIDLFRASDGTLKKPASIQKALALAGITPDDAVITYCTIGNRASQIWFALKYLLDYPNVRVYYGSWVEWGMQPDAAVETKWLKP